MSPMTRVAGIARMARIGLAAVLLAGASASLAAQDDGASRRERWRDATPEQRGELPGAEQGDLIKNRRADAIFNSLFVGHRSIRQVAEAVDMTLLPLSDDVVKKVADSWKIAPYTIKGGSYAWQPADTGTVTLSAQLVASNSLDPAVAYDVAKALVEHVDKVQAVHKAMQPLGTKLLASGLAVPYHAGAAKYYKEAGLQ